MSKLDKDREKLFERLTQGETYRRIADAHNVDISTLYSWFHKKANIERYAAALTARADFYAEKAEEFILNAPSDKVELMRARELAHHWRWRASKSNPNKYGERASIDLQGKLEVHQITGMEIK